MVIPPLPTLLSWTPRPSLLLSQLFGNSCPVIEPVLSNEVEDSMILLGKDVRTSALHDCLLIAYNIWYTFKNNSAWEVNAATCSASPIPRFVWPIPISPTCSRCLEGSRGTKPIYLRLIWLYWLLGRGQRLGLFLFWHRSSPQREACWCFSTKIWLLPCLFEGWFYLGWGFIYLLLGEMMAYRYMGIFEFGLSCETMGFS